MLILVTCRRIGLNPGIDILRFVVGVSCLIERLMAVPDVKFEM